jgi:hypothetical protein
VVLAAELGLAGDLPVDRAQKRQTHYYLLTHELSSALENWWAH